MSKTDVEQGLNTLKGVVALFEYIALNETPRAAADVVSRMVPGHLEWFWNGVYHQAYAAMELIEAIETALPSAALGRELPAPVEGGE